MPYDRNKRYREDAEYRAKVNKANRERYYRRMQNPFFAKLHATRARITNARNAIERHEARLEFFHRRIMRDLALIAKMKRGA